MQRRGAQSSPSATDRDASISSSPRARSKTIRTSPTRSSPATRRGRTGRGRRFGWSMSSPNGPDTRRTAAGDERRACAPRSAGNQSDQRVTPGQRWLALPVATQHCFGTRRPGGVPATADQSPPAGGFSVRRRDDDGVAVGIGDPQPAMLRVGVDSPRNRTPPAALPAVRWCRRLGGSA